jgi:pimeloyl-ACP methyl ester carboxylesterase
MKNLRTYGKAPFSVAAIHGGPGAAGEMAPIARKLASGRGVLEPLQTGASVAAQIKELKTVLEKNGGLPVILIGFSWGAWLCFIFAADYPEFVKKLILVGSGPFTEEYAAKTQQTRLARLSGEERTEAESLIRALGYPASQGGSTAFARLGALLSKADAYDAIRYQSGLVDYRPDIFQSVWKDAAELRSSGKLLGLGKKITCPVVAIHGDYDPHPAEGVQKPLSTVLKDFHFILLKNCGHMPWIERQARDEFYRILEAELQ